MHMEKVDSVLNQFGRRGTSLISLLAGLLAAALLIYGGYALYDTMYINHSAESSWDLLKYKPEFIEDNNTPQSGFRALQEINSDVGAWLTVYDSKIDYPVAQGEDDLEYINKTVYGDFALSGSIYMSSFNKSDYSDPYCLLYGHHMDNGAMFGELEYFMEDEYFADHREGILITPAAVYDLTFFACLETDAYDNEIYGIRRVNDEMDGFSALEAYIAEKAAQYDKAAADTNKILALSTCAGAKTNGRTVVFAYMTERPQAADETAAMTKPVSAPNSTPGTGASETAAQTEELQNEELSSDESSLPSGSSSPVHVQEPNEMPVEEIEEIEDAGVPLAEHFNPRGGLDDNCWALLNLVCLLLTIYIFLPIHKLGAKFRRRHLMKKLNKEHQELVRNGVLMACDTDIEENKNGNNSDTEDSKEEKLYLVKRFTVKFWIGVILELVISAIALIGFLHTENMRLMMVIIDKWTPIMILWLLLCWLADLLLVRYRRKTEIIEAKPVPEK